MSLVGPRPERPHFVEQFKDEIPKYLERHRVKTGMTGWAQVNGRDELPIPVKVQFDYEYLHRRSIIFDLQMIGMTVVKVVSGEGIQH